MGTLARTRLIYGSTSAILLKKLKNLLFNWYWAQCMQYAVLMLLAAEVLNSCLIINKGKYDDITTLLP